MLLPGRICLFVLLCVCFGSGHFSCNIHIHREGSDLRSLLILLQVTEQVNLAQFLFHFNIMTSLYFVPVCRLCNAEFVNAWTIFLFIISSIPTTERYTYLHLFLIQKLWGQIPELLLLQVLLQLLMWWEKPRTHIMNEGRTQRQIPVHHLVSISQ